MFRYSATGVVGYRGLGVGGVRERGLVTSYWGGIFIILHLAFSICEGY